jgi:hypothetical protein
MITRVDNHLVTASYKDCPQYVRFVARPAITRDGIDGLVITLVDNTRKVGQERSLSLTGTDIAALRDLLNDYFPRGA